jgi:hypothetical protein
VAEGCSKYDRVGVVAGEVVAVVVVSVVVVVVMLIGLGKVGEVINEARPNFLIIWAIWIFILNVSQHRVAM